MKKSALFEWRETLKEERKTWKMMEDLGVQKLIENMEEGWEVVKSDSTRDIAEEMDLSKGRVIRILIEDL